jgi:hypothetical protein
VGTIKRQRAEEGNEHECRKQKSKRESELSQRVAIKELGAYMTERAYIVRRVC